jgi:hypothetical protein
MSFGGLFWADPVDSNSLDHDIRFGPVAMDDHEIPAVIGLWHHSHRSV